jgi:sugar lactone lactonase YvrE
MQYQPVTVQVALTARARLGEGACWDAEAQRLYWVDIYNHRIHYVDIEAGFHQFVELDDVVTCVAPMEHERLLVAQRHQLVELDLNTGAIAPLTTFDAETQYPNNRLNDGKCDSQGRFWVGSMNPEQPHASLYRYDLDGSVHVMEKGLTISNGLGWSPMDDLFYLTDTPRQRIYVYDFDASTGAIQNRRVCVDLSHESFFPDGLTLDQEGCLWSAMWDGGCVIRFDPDGQEMMRVTLPVQRPTCCVFGGNDMKTLFITSASVGLSEAEIEQGFYSGDVFSVSLDVAGMLTYRRRSV